LDPFWLGLIAAGDVAATEFVIGGRLRGAWRQDHGYHSRSIDW